MKALKIVGHPVAIITTFLLIMINGEGFGGPYLLYLILALPHGGDYAVAGVGGLLCLLISYKIYRGERKHSIKPLLALIGIILLVYSLYLFFNHDRLRYNYGTFEDTVPVISLVLFSICTVCGIIVFITEFINNTSGKNGDTINSLRKA